MQIKYFFDFLSPYSYLSWEHLKAEGAFAEYNFSLHPVTLATIIHHYACKGPAEIPPKRKYLFKDCLRFARLNSIKFRPPKELPFNSLYALRLALLEVAGTEHNQWNIIDRIFRAGWQQGLHIGEEEVLLELLKELGLPGQQMLDQVCAKSTRQALKENNSLALEKEVFGLPAFLVDDELFWGNDSIPYLKMYLQNIDPMDRQEFDAFSENYFLGE